MATFAPRLQRGTVFRILLISVIVVIVVVAALATYSYFMAVNRFEVRRVALPTRVFADMFPLRPGVAISAEDLAEKLQRLGYRERKNIQQAGDYTSGDEGMEIHLRGFDHPSGKMPSQPVTVRVKSGVVAAVTRDAQAVEDAALEPELLTSILSDELENRTPVTLDQVPKHLIDAVIATEDARFFTHPGVDPMGVMRALWRNIREQEVAQGGSTLTQQLVKNYYLTSERTVRRKVVEAFMSLILDAKYSKREILEAYLNDIYLGRNRSISILGVGQAAQFYFGKPVSEINLPEAALLAAMIRSPNNYSPFADAAKAKQRRDIVLNLMVRNRKIRKSEADVAMQHPLPDKPHSGTRTTLETIPYYVDRVLDELKIDYGFEEVEGQGLSIYTAIDLVWQSAATEQLQTGLRSLERTHARIRRAGEPLQGAMIAVDVESGEIRSLVGGRDYERSQFNRATAAKRQVGSLFKPFVFLAAFEPSLSHQNITPGTLVNDSRFVLERRYSKDWSPRNYEDAYYGVVTVRKALEKSMNSASVRIGLATGVDSVIKAARAMGVETKLPNVPSIILGSVGVPPIEMAEAYTTMARMGSRIPLRAVRFVTNDRGQLLAHTDEIEPVQVFPSRDVYLLVHLMEGVMNRGTAAASRSFGFRKIAAGKTGTTNDKRDAWFIGFTPQTLAATWVGFDSNAPVGVSGSDGAVPIWAKYMRDITAAQQDRDFPVPSGIVFAELDSDSGGLSTETCPRTAIVNEAFKAGTEPSTLCPLHSLPMFAGEMYPYGMPYPTTTDLTTTDLPPLPPLPPLTTTQTPQPQPIQPAPTERREPILEGGSFRTDTTAPAPEVRRDGEPPPQPEVPPPTTTSTQPPG